MCCLNARESAVGTVVVVSLRLQFGNWSLLQAYFNNQSDLSNSYHLKWATLSEYFDAQVSSNVTFPVVQPGGDYVPYTFLDFWWYWSGYFVSRPVLKGAIRQQYALLQATERLYTLAKTLQPSGTLLPMRRFVSLPHTRLRLHDSLCASNLKLAISQVCILRCAGGGWLSRLQQGRTGRAH